jgi:hypothetical protein
MTLVEPSSLEYLLAQRGQDMVPDDREAGRRRNYGEVQAGQWIRPIPAEQPEGAGMRKGQRAVTDVR